MIWKQQRPWIISSILRADSVISQKQNFPNDGVPMLFVEMSPQNKS